MAPFETRSYLDDFLRAVRRLDVHAVSRLSAAVFEAWRHGRTVFVCGNGGSACSASHLATDLSKLTGAASRPVKRLKAVALTESASALTAIGNDIAFEEVFAEQLRTFLQPGDVLIALSTSGASPNVLRAVEHANEHGGLTLAITGRNGQPLAAIAHECLVIDATSVQQIEDATMLAGHLVCLQVAQRIAGVAAMAPHAAVGPADVTAGPTAM